MLVAGLPVEYHGIAISTQQIRDQPGPVGSCGSPHAKADALLEPLQDIQRQNEHAKKHLAECGVLRWQRLTSRNCPLSQPPRRLDPERTASPCFLTYWTNHCRLMRLLLAVMFGAEAFLAEVMKDMDPDPTMQDLEGVGNGCLQVFFFSTFIRAFFVSVTFLGSESHV